MRLSLAEIIRMNDKQSRVVFIITALLFSGCTKLTLTKQGMKYVVPFEVSKGNANEAIQEKDLSPQPYFFTADKTKKTSSDGYKITYKD